jgi:hypothetical protein
MQCPRCGYTEDCSDVALIDYDRLEARPKRGPKKKLTPSREGAPDDKKL